MHYLNSLTTKEWLEYWCSTYDLEEIESETNICYYFPTTNCIWDGEEFATNVPVDLAEYIKTRYPSNKRKRKSAYRIGVAYELTRVIEIHFSRRAIITRFLEDMEK